MTGRRHGPLEAIAGEVGGVAVAGDTGDPAHVHETVAAAVSRFGGVDILVACAGVAPGGAVGDMDDAQWRYTLDTNLSGPMMMSRAALPVMLERGGGSIVLVSSTAGLAAAPASAAYDVSKAGLIALARALAVDYGTRGNSRERARPWVGHDANGRPIHGCAWGTGEHHAPGRLRPRDRGRANASRWNSRGDGRLLSVPGFGRVALCDRYNPCCRWRWLGRRTDINAVHLWWAIDVVPATTCLTGLH